MIDGTTQSIESRRSAGIHHTVQDMKETPPFRADHVGSLLRPPEIQRARALLADGKLTPEALAAQEDNAIRRAIAKQESLGLRSITDGEIRRATWMGDFLYALEGTSVVTAELPSDGQQGGTPVKTIKIPTVTAKIGFAGHPMLEHFRFLREHTKATPKLSIPAPAMIVSALRDWREIVSTEAYPEIDEFYLDLGLAYRDAVRAFYEAGCRYLQFDDVNLAYLCDAKSREKLESRGDDPEAMLRTWVDVVNTAISDRPADLVICTHICRGNFRSRWLAEGGYEPIADALFNEFDYDGYFLEYDTERAGSFEPLRFVPKGQKFIVLGLLTTKSGTLEDRDLIKSRIDEAARLVDVDQLCLSPQCGFASTEEGNVITEDEQWAKLGEVVEIARQVWPDA
jgi:5-methyltetrahydropteroyltriglutamate--homocysteine methyltransferase